VDLICLLGSVLLLIVSVSFAIWKLSQIGNSEKSKHIVGSS